MNVWLIFWGICKVTYNSLLKVLITIQNVMKFLLDKVSIFI